MTKVNPGRLAVLISLVAFSVLCTLTGSWKAVLEYPDVVRVWQFRIVAEEYALKNGTTVEEIRKRHQANALKTYRKEKDAGLPDCDWFLTRGKPCALQPIANGGPLIGFPKNSLSEIFEANRRALPSLTILFSDLIKAVGIAISICFAAPALVKRTWSWLQNGSRNAN